MTSMREEGWYVDPFGAHEQRWFSNGMPTALVRDGAETTTDVPPSPTWDRPVVPLEPVVENAGADLLRADAPPRPAALFDNGPTPDPDEQLAELARPWWNRRLPVPVMVVLGGAAVALRIWVLRHF